MLQETLSLSLSTLTKSFSHYRAQLEKDKHRPLVYKMLITQKEKLHIRYLQM